jgi:hypothetical protein
MTVIRWVATIVGIEILLLVVLALSSTHGWWRFYAACIIVGVGSLILRNDLQ